MTILNNPSPIQQHAYPHNIVFNQQDPNVPRESLGHCTSEYLLYQGSCLSCHTYLPTYVKDYFHSVLKLESILTLYFLLLMCRYCIRVKLVVFEWSFSDRCAK
uniref:Uncharacterized protein n=1 Tax=Oryza brachyantha TaxID=4533 RepID=J3M906_ORYBR